jgi:2-polyprenyl-3-methyl-5-hydroxy-6-metoxy-1,4-benzoquinol methylase
MIRVPEPELMDEAEQARAYAEADFSEPNQLFVDAFRARFPRFDGRSVLDLGCGPADICIRLARALPGARVVGVDGARAMIDLARSAVDAAGLARQVQLIEARLGADSALQGSFDAVVSNSLLHHLSDPAALWDAVWRHGGPGAPVMVMDLMRPASPQAAQAIVEEYSGGEPEVLRRDFYNSLRAAYRLEEVREQLRAFGLEGLSCEAVSDRHLMVWGRRPSSQGTG